MATATKAKGGTVKRPRPVKNTHGVYSRPKRIGIPFRGSTKVIGAIRLVEDTFFQPDHRWRGGYELKHSQGGCSAPPKDFGEGHSSQQDAMLAAVGRLRKHLLDAAQRAETATEKKRLRDAMEDLASFRQTIDQASAFNANGAASSVGYAEYYTAERLEGRLYEPIERHKVWGPVRRKCWRTAREACQRDAADT